MVRKANGRRWKTLRSLSLRSFSSPSMRTSHPIPGQLPPKDSNSQRQRCEATNLETRSGPKGRSGSRELKGGRRRRESNKGGRGSEGNGGGSSKSGQRSPWESASDERSERHRGGEGQKGGRGMSVVVGGSERSGLLLGEEETSVLFLAVRSDLQSIRSVSKLQ